MLSRKRSRELLTQIESLKYQHERCRNQTSEMAKSLNGYEKGDEIQRVKLIENLAAYIALLKLHLKWEDTIFYPAAKKEITEQEEQMLLADFQKEEKKMTETAIQHCIKLIKEMQSLL
jgi:hemerythrin-like domain-containing protein